MNEVSDIGPIFALSYRGYRNLRSQISFLTLNHGRTGLNDRLRSQPVEQAASRSDISINSFVSRFLSNGTHRRGKTLFLPCSFSSAIRFQTDFSEGLELIPTRYTILSLSPIFIRRPFQPEIPAVQYTIKPTWHREKPDTHHSATHTDLEN